MPLGARKNAKIIPLRGHIPWRGDSHNLETLIAALAGVSAVTEDSFLVLGREIRMFHGRAREISKAAGQVLQLLHGDAGENTLLQLQLLVERCSLWLSAKDKMSTEIRALLNNVVNQMSGLYEPVVGLRKVIKTLHALRVSTRIEAAKGYASGAGVLAKSLDELSRLIHTKIAEIFDRTEALVPMINSSLRKQEAVQSGAIRIASQEVKKARWLLNGFLANRIETGQWTDRLKGRSDDVTQNFGEMISALQFEDITRQRLVHVQEALDGLGEHLDEFSQRSDFSRDAEASRLFGCICRLQHDQLLLASQEFLAAADTLSANLQGMVVCVVSMAEDTRELSRTTSVSCEGGFAAVLDVLKTIAGCLDEAHRIHQTAGAHLTDICHELRKVAGLIEDVERIGEEIQLLAMNAAIGAAHARQQGAGLDIIAENINDVAEEASNYALMLARVCETITSHAVDLQGVEQESQSNAGDVGNLLAEAQEYIATIEGNAVNLLRLVSEVDRAAGKLSADVNMVVETANVRKGFQEKLAPVLRHLNGLGSSIGDEVTASDGVNLEALFLDLERCYTMDSERRVHKRFIAKVSPLQPVASIETDEWSSNREHGLGDNVDLF